MDLQQLVQQNLDDLVASGTETGLQVAVYRKGELIVDAVAGVADLATGQPVPGRVAAQRGATPPPGSASR
ncbi:beta-lactamase family protein [Kribbella sp. NBC_00382]|uniref:serine hydrolase n=1 Tax=Kribbella sp. NBC_00382 TaxID=2975967 RepID=UPI002E1B3DB1